MRQGWRCMRQVATRSKNTGFGNQLRVWSLCVRHQAGFNEGKSYFFPRAQAADKCQSESEMTRRLLCFHFFFSTKGKIFFTSVSLSAKEIDALWHVAALTRNVADRRLHFQDTWLKEKLKGTKWRFFHFQWQEISLNESLLKSNLLDVPTPGDGATCWISTADPDLWLTWRTDPGLEMQNSKPALYSGDRSILT